MPERDVFRAVHAICLRDLETCRERLAVAEREREELLRAIANSVRMSAAAFTEDAEKLAADVRVEAANARAERLAAAERDLQGNRGMLVDHELRLGRDRELLHREVAKMLETAKAEKETAKARAERLAAALKHVRDHLCGVECREYHAGLNDGRHPGLVLLQIMEPALAADAAGEGMQASQVSDVTASDADAAGDAHGR